MNERAGVPAENKMGVMPEGRLLLTISLPMMLSMMMQALYNIVDSVFVAHLSESALTAVSLAFPVQNLMIALSTGTNVGVNALLSRSLGEKNHANANKTANNSIFLATLNFVAFASVGVLAARPYFEMQTSDAAIIGDGIAYMTICCLCSFGLFYQMAFSRLLQSTGLTFYSMIIQLTGVLINAFMDPVLIFGLLGFPKMGIAGAALATIFGQIVAASLAIYFNIKKNTEIKLNFRGFRPDGKIIKMIYAVGVPSIIMGSIGSVMNFGINRILLRFTPTATAVYGVFCKLQTFVFMPVFGLNNGMVPILAYNYGARKPKRIRKTIFLAIASAVAIMTAGCLIFWIFTPQLLGIFKASDTMMQIGIPALRISSLSYLLAGFCIVTLSVCQAMGRGLFSLAISVARQLVLLLPAAYLLARFRGLESVWYAFPVAEVATAFMCFYILRQLFKNDIGLLPEQAAAPPDEILPPIIE